MRLRLRIQTGERVNEEEALMFAGFNVVTAMLVAPITGFHTGGGGGALGFPPPPPPPPPPQENRRQYKFNIKLVGHTQI